MSRPVPVWLRLFLLLVTAEALYVGFGLFKPAWVSTIVPWPVSPLNARFIASLYAAMGLGVIGCIVARTYEEVRIPIAGVGILTGLLLAITLERLLTHPAEITRFPAAWLVAYVVDPILAVFTLRRLGWRADAARRLSPVAALWGVDAALFGLLGAVLLLAPAAGILIWPWAMTEAQAQLYAGVFLSYAITEALAIREPSWPAVRWPALIFFLLPIFVLIISFVHLERFRPTASTPIWFLVLALQLLAFGGLLAGHVVGSIRKGAPEWGSTS
jgi:hypothetical protein